MRIIVDDLPTGGRRLSGRADLVLGGDREADELSVEGPAAYELEFSRLGTTVTVRGHVGALVHAFCSRCGQSVDFPIDRDVEAVFVTADTGETDRSVELDESDLDLDYYEGGVIDGLRLLAEQVFLELPMKVVCAEDCEGLCVQCGANLNHNDCDCEAEVDPRWASLKDLRDQL